MSKRNPITFDQVIRGIIVIAATLAALWLINDLKNVLLPFCLACLISYVLEPVVLFQQKKFKFKMRTIPVLLTLLETIIVLVGLGFILIPMATKEINQLDVMIRASSGHQATFLPTSVAEFINKHLNIEELRRYFDPQQISDLFAKGTSVLTASIDIIMRVIEWLLTFIYVIFIMLDYPKLMTGFRKIIPPRYRSKTYPILDDIKVNMDRYFRSQALIAACAAVFYCVGFSIAGLPLAVLMGLAVGVLYMIPYVQYVTVIPVLVLCYLDSLTGMASFWPAVGKCAIVYVVSQCICDYVLTPRIMGKTLGMNPAIILLSLSIWGTLLGILGMIIALPVTALMIAYYKEYVLSIPREIDRIKV